MDNQVGSVFIWKVVGFICPLLGLILYIHWYVRKPLYASAAITGALWGVVVPIVIVYVLSLFTK